MGLRILPAIALTALTIPGVFILIAVLVSKGFSKMNERERTLIAKFHTLLMVISVIAIFFFLIN